MSLYIPPNEKTAAKLPYFKPTGYRQCSKKIVVNEAEPLPSVSTGSGSAVLRVH
jgi:hypothetical protein